MKGDNEINKRDQSCLDKSGLQTWIGLRLSRQMDGRNVEDYCVMTEGSRQWMERIYTKLRLSPRAYHRIIKVSRTIADLDQSELIEDIHVQEAYG